MDCRTGKSAVSYTHLDVYKRQFHLFAGSQNLKSDAIVEAQCKSFDLALRLAQAAPSPVRFLNLGGGFGIPYFPGEAHLDLGPIGANPVSYTHLDVYKRQILYTSGSTGKPKGVVLSHRNMVAGAKSVASYLENSADDTLLAALPLSFDAGFSQLTTAFHVGARVVLLNYLMPRDVLKALERERVTGLTAVPPLFIQLTQLELSLIHI